MLEFFHFLLDTKGFPQRWYCGTAWTPELGWSHIISDLVIFISYMSIPIGILVIARKRKYVRYKVIIWLFASFIICCGVTHLIEASIFWYPWYRLSAFSKIITAFISFTTAACLLWMAPALLKVSDGLKQRHYLKYLITNIPNPLLVIDQKLNIVMMNEEFTSYTGYKSLNVHRSFFQDILVAGSEKMFNKAVDLCLLQKESIKQNLRIRHKDNTITNVEMTFVYLNHFGDIEILISIKDLEQDLRLKKDLSLRKMSAQLKSIFDGASDGIIISDEKGNINSANKNAAKMFEYSATELINKNFDDLIKDKYTKDYITKIFENDSEDYEIKQIDKIFTGITKNNHQLSVEVYGGKLKLDNEYIYTAFLRDISDRIKLETKIKSAYAELESFSYIAAHDLKEPLRGISNYSSFLNEDYGQILDKKGRDMLKTLQKLSKRLEDFIESLFQYSRVTKDGQAFNMTDLNEVVEDVLLSVQINIKEKKCKIIFNHDLPSIKCQAIKIREVFLNLVSNAFKYSDKDNKTIEIGCIKDDNIDYNPYIFYVKDNGIGIEKEHHELVFKMFKRLHSRDDFDGGSGAGLSIVKKIIEHHNGKIWIESTAGQGTTFYFIIGENE